MALSERDRHDAYEALQATFGDRTDTVIQMLRPDHDHLATRDDLAVEMATLRTELKTEMAELRVAFSNDINSAFAAQTRSLLIALVGSVMLLALSTSLTVLVR